ncbi:MAG: CPXCG motif-containing cysteine-rich protein [Nitrospina sp.]|jgi:transcription elongation factor Elf1|nr:CPXCG motif-containing cysteine-rich protein [Nitrospina sp.]
MDEIEKFFNCPYCGELISMLIDLSFNNQFYEEDCEVCCRPIEISFTVVDEEIASWEALRND